MYEYNEKFKSIKGKTLTLELILYKKGNNVEVPYYWYNIIKNDTFEIVGKVSIRLGHNFHSYYNGNIGYEVFEEYRGNNYAYQASKMIIEIAKEYEMKKLYLTCNVDNIASYKTIEKLGAYLIEIVKPPKEYFGYYEKIKEHRIYQLDIK